MVEAQADGQGGTPRVWVLTGHKAGDNSQVLALAGALGWPFEVKRLVYRPWELLTNRLPGGTLAGIDRGASSPLAPPWPDLVISAGRRNEPVARWIRRQSGGHTRLVHVGRPWAPLHCYDLIVTTPQYFLPARPNVLHIDLPLHALDRQRLDRLAPAWEARFRDLPRPWWVVLLGGDSGPFVFTPEKAARLAAWLNDVVTQSGGSVLVTDSARTPKAAYEAFLCRLDVPVHAFHWSSGAEDNPYQGYLAVADRLVVTGESMSMLAEARAAGRPLYIFDLSDCPQGLGGGRPCRPWWWRRSNFRYRPLSHRLAMRIAPRRMRRDVSRIQQRLVASGAAVWAGEAAGPGRAPAVDEDLERTAARVRALLAPPPGDGG
ncbi:MAG TPA: nucleoside-diphosphate sugar epimerase [Gammaproteobacteria bacterium]|nr:nucleoside-diphosphate sugar epimerase [Gammaproteobacteria bacterium]